MDYKPRKVFDMFAPPGNKYSLFNATFMHEQLDAIAKATGTEITEEDSDKKVKGKKLKDLSQQTDEIAGKWADRNKILLLGAVMVLDEFKRYFHNRHPHNPYGKLLGHVIDQWRHLDLLMLGMTPMKRQIDAISCLPHVTHDVKCSWNGLRDEAECRIFRTRYVGRRGVMELTGKPILVRINGHKPRPELGGHRYYDLWNSKNMHNLRPVGGIKI